MEKLLRVSLKGYEITNLTTVDDSGAHVEDSMLVDVGDAPDTVSPTFWQSCMSCPARCWLLHGERQNIDTFDNDTVEVEQGLSRMRGETPARS